MDRIVRICEIEINGFKNVNHGSVELEGADDIRKVSLLGIYGQNGSGKTSIIEVVEFIQKLMMGLSLPNNTDKYINKEKKACEIKVVFYVEYEEHKGKVQYIIRLDCVDESVEIAKEELSYKEWNGEKFETKRIIVDSSNKDMFSYKPKCRFEALIKANPENKINLAMAKKISHRDKCSFIFSEEGIKLFAPRFFELKEKSNESCISVTSEFDFYIKALHDYAWMDLFVITSKHNGPISMELLMPVAFRIRHEEGVAKGDIPIILSEPTVIPEKEYRIVKKVISEINIVLETVIPNMTLEVHNHGSQLLDDGSEGNRIELLSNREGIKIPLKYESEGIIKIVSILNVLMCVYNSPGTCMVIDELDSGIFEFLLGEILNIFEEGAKGQLIFTSHNLRALEMIDKKYLIFSTTNENNRYIRLKGVKNNNNLRDLYIRSILLGGQSEEIYSETDSIEIGRSIRKAGRISNNGC